MVENPLAQHAPAVKVGGRRLSSAARPTKPAANPEASDKKPDAAEKKDANEEEESSDEESSEEEEGEEATKRRKNKDNDRKKKDYAHRKAESTRPTRDAQGGFKAFASQRIGQPAGKGNGV
ncbi:hypothetical protein FA15DRAFT_669723 [Coprinopsis marcescibilis]|uniref:Uncharacterized protein n=1 Tax=Coprinopsis marcescibilis TaxID=230819 RepID=A0A5C3KV09_COPMA|nr:hypothetical protein FA15DRAFT_669723 [Coprinopsis marcescibilis]